jgi:hypothetical protein
MLRVIFFTGTVSADLFFFAGGFFTEKACILFVIYITVPAFQEIICVLPGAMQAETNIAIINTVFDNITVKVAVTGCIIVHVSVIIAIHIIALYLLLSDR